MTKIVKYVILANMAEKIKEPRPRVVLDVPKKGGKEIWKTVRQRAIAEERPVSEWVFEAFREKLARETKK